MENRPPDKWDKFKVLKDAERLKRYLPETKRFTRKSLWFFIRKYCTVMLKPYNGKSGYGIIQVSQLEEDRFAIRHENRQIIMDGKRAVLKQLQKMTGLQKYMVQRRICLAEIEKRPFDIKVIVQRKKRLSWKATDMIAVVAEKDYVVTNVSRTVLPVKQAVALSLLKQVRARTLLRKMKDICLMAAKQLGDQYPSQNIIGFDIGLDRDSKLWIIEANFKPSMKPFLMLEKDT